MDRIRVAVDRLWGPLGNNGELHGSPRFAAELADHYNGKLKVINPLVSKWSYGHQLEHLYRTSHYVLDRLEESMTGLNSSERMGAWGVGMMAGGFLPRYYFPTIAQLVPLSGSPEDIEPLKDDLRSRLEQLKWRYDDITASKGKSKQPRMKYLTATQWLFFADIHHRHHLAIMRGILKTAG